VLIAMLLTDYEINLEVLKCSPHSQEAGCLVDLGQDISEVFPYLNAQLRRCRYNPDAPTLEISYEGRGFALHARRIAFGGVGSREEAERVVESVRALINETWDRRAEITPSYRQGPCLSPLALYQLLPKLNCGQCGDATCLAFAAKLARERSSVSRCRPLLEPAHAVRRAGLVSVLLDAGYEVSEEWL
jgi:ArsR family metal-binding transcriptional regulator